MRHHANTRDFWLELRIHRRTSGHHRLAERQTTTERSNPLETGMDIIKTAVIQHACGPDKATNLAAGLAAIAEAASTGAHLAVLQELHTLSYFCQTEDPAHFDLAEPLDGASATALAQAAARHRIVIVASLFERRLSGLYHNTAIVFDRDGRCAGCYRKMHIPDDPGFYEKFYFTPGDHSFQPVDTSIGRLGILVCWDQWFPEAARLMALAGARILIYPTAIGWDPRDDTAEQQRQRQAWETIQRAHAIANALPVVVANRCGFEPCATSPATGIRFWGSSFLCGVQGELLAQAGVDEPAVITAELDLRRTESVRRMWPFFRDRRIDAYHGLLERCRDDPAGDARTGNTRSAPGSSARTNRQGSDR